MQSQGMWSEGLGKPVMSAMEVMAVLRSFGIGKFAGAVMWVLHEAFENEECLLELEMRNEKLGIERKLPQINRELKEKNFVPWMICEPNEKEGRKLLEEIMKGGNFSFHIPCFTIPPFFSAASRVSYCPKFPPFIISSNNFFPSFSLGSHNNQGQSVIINLSSINNHIGSPSPHDRQNIPLPPHISP